MEFDPVSYLMGASAGSGGGGGGGTVNWHDSFTCNWDFANPVNTRGQSIYSSSSMVYTLDGWQLTGGTLDIVTGGVQLSRYAAETPGYFIQRYKPTPTAAFIGFPMVMSAIIDGELAQTAVTVTNVYGDKGNFTLNGVRVRAYYYGTQKELGITIDIDEDTGSHLIQAIKLEAGTTSTLATNIGGILTLNNRMDADTEKIKIASGWVYNA